MAHEILVTAHRPNSPFRFLDLAWTLDLDLASGLSIFKIQKSIFYEYLKIVLYMFITYLLKLAPEAISGFVSWTMEKIGNLTGR